MGNNLFLLYTSAVEKWHLPKKIRNIASLPSNPALVFTQYFMYYQTSWNKKSCTISYWFAIFFLNIKNRFLRLLFLKFWCFIYSVFPVTGTYYQCRSYKHRNLKSIGTWPVVVCIQRISDFTESKSRNSHSGLFNMKCFS